MGNANTVDIDQSDDLKNVEDVMEPNGDVAAAETVVVAGTVAGTGAAGSLNDTNTTYIDISANVNDEVSLDTQPMLLPDEQGQSEAVATESMVTVVALPPNTEAKLDETAELPLAEFKPNETEAANEDEMPQTQPHDVVQQEQHEQDMEQQPEHPQTRPQMQEQTQTQPQAAQQQKSVYPEQEQPKETPETIPATPQTPTQPYAYSPYPYYPPMPGYMPSHTGVPPPTTSPPDCLMTGQTNPYHYKDASYHADPPEDDQRNRGGVTEPFPQKLHRMLECTERDGMTDVVSFFSHGRAFAIHKPRRFVTEVMSKFFRQSKLTSFQRQLNLYGFRRISQGPDNGGYYHELFLKGRPGLCVNMKRTKVKGNQKLKRDPDTEPNFYAYPPITPGTPYPQPPIPATSPYSSNGYMYPPVYPPYGGSPYTAAQQGSMPQSMHHPQSPPHGAYAGYSYPPSYGYPWYSQPAHMPPSGSPSGVAPQTSPIKINPRKDDDEVAGTTARKLDVTNEGNEDGTVTPDKHPTESAV